MYQVEDWSKKLDVQSCSSACSKCSRNDFSCAGLIKWIMVVPFWLPNGLSEIL